jgi:FtsP/CotA-like multicopper oxidase with cupredoxin domain
MDHAMHGPGKDGIEWEDTMAMMNTGSTDESVKWFLKDVATGARNMAINYSFKQGDYVKIRLFNDPQSPHPMQHPIHFHGNRFLVLSVNGAQTTNPVWKDTTLVPSGATVDILLEASNPGTWMAHCHISEHLLSGMMIGYTVK